MLAYAIQKSDMDLRRVLFSNIVLSGGSTLFKGISLKSITFECGSYILTPHSLYKIFGAGVNGYLPHDLVTINRNKIWNVFK